MNLKFTNLPNIKSATNIASSMQQATYSMHFQDEVEILLPLNMKNHILKLDPNSPFEPVIPAIIIKLTN